MIFFTDSTFSWHIFCFNWSILLIKQDNKEGQANKETADLRLWHVNHFNVLLCTVSLICKKHMKAYSILLQYNNVTICQVFIAIYIILPKFLMCWIYLHISFKMAALSTSKHQAFTNCKHGYNRIHNVHTHSVTCARKWCYTCKEICARFSLRRHLRTTYCLPMQNIML